MMNITRRDFFKVLGATALGLALPAVKAGKALRAVEPEPEPEPPKPGWTNDKYLRYREYHPVHAVLIDGDLRLDGNLYIKGHKIEIE